MTPHPPARARAASVSPPVVFRQRAAVFLGAEQGSYFCATKDEPEQVKLDETIELEELYSAACVSTPACEAVERTQHFYMERLDCMMPPEMAKMMEDISTRVALYGEGLDVCSTSVDEECERELESEKEQEKEVEKQIARAEPAEEEDWNYELALTANSPVIAGARVSNFRCTYSVRLMPLPHHSLMNNYVVCYCLFCVDAGLKDYHTNWSSITSGVAEYCVGQDCVLHQELLANPAGNYKSMQLPTPSQCNARVVHQRAA